VLSVSIHITKGQLVVRWSSHGHTHGRFRRFRAITLAAASTISLALPTQVLASEVTCRETQFPVTIAGAANTMSGTLCTPATGTRTIQLLIPGGFYNRSYWDIPLAPEIRSFRRAMTNAGYATLTVDRLGTGRSSTPPSILLTAITQANAVHQVVKALRAGTTGTVFEKVILGGHSLGSAIAITEAATYGDVDGVLVTGMAHRLNVLGIVPIFATFMPAALDQTLRREGLDLGYLTTMPGTRFNSLHKPGTYNPAVADLEESTKDVAAPGELVDGALLGTITPFTRLVNVPVLSAMASHDPTFCGALLATDCTSADALRRSEQLYYSPAARLQTYVLPGYGHSFNYAPNAPGFHKAVIRWADSMIGR
jgi:pimeloyl-ACP methyl ester carboxylesterase